MAVQIGARPDSGFDDPIGMLKDCHRRIERFVDILFHVAHQAQGRALNHEEQSAVEAALLYFDESGPRHNRDEEDSLFPRLRSMEARTVLAEVQRLEHEHQEAGALHHVAGQTFLKWIAERYLSSDEALRLLAVTEQMQKIYREHIQIEEDIVFPFAARLLNRTELATMGSEFRIRRERS